MARKNEVNGSGRVLKGPAWVKPYQDPSVKDVQVVVKSDGTPDIDAIHRKTGLAKTTIRNLFSGKTRQPQPTTLRFILRYYGKELVVRDIGKNE